MFTKIIFLDEWPIISKMHSPTNFKQSTSGLGIIPQVSTSMVMSAAMLWNTENFICASWRYLNELMQISMAVSLTLTIGCDSDSDSDSKMNMFMTGCNSSRFRVIMILTSGIKQSHLRTLFGYSWPLQLN